MDLMTAMWMVIISYSFLITCGILLALLGVYIFYKLCRANTDNRYERERYIENFEYRRV